jgi:microfibrillar-associated protein 1
MQDKSMLPEILQRRKGNFGKKGQSKYKHLTAEDTTNFDPQFRADESILDSWKKKMAGYKGSKGSNI